MNGQGFFLALILIGSPAHLWRNNLIRLLKQQLRKAGCYRNCITITGCTPSVIVMQRQLILYSLICFLFTISFGILSSGKSFVIKFLWFKPDVKVMKTVQVRYHDWQTGSYLNPNINPCKSSSICFISILCDIAPKITWTQILELRNILLSHKYNIYIVYTNRNARPY